ncbi:hypothetical protein UlMin_029229 [Ulmus minor]
MAEPKIFSLRIVSVDYCMAAPIPDLDVSYSSFQGERVNEVPVIRVYGSTPAGQKTCLHVHRVLPYLYVPCADIPIQAHQEGDAYSHAVSRAMEKALKLKSKAGLKRQYVHGCSLVRARKFYGYHSSEELFVKIYLYHPHDVSRAANLLLGGAVFDKCLQPHEAHIPFILQFLVDYNLYGMGHLHLSRMKFRYPLPDVFSPNRSFYNGKPGQDMDLSTCMPPDFQADISGNSSSGLPVWVTSTIPADWMWHSPSEFDASSNPSTNTFNHQSLCQLEGDCIVDDILNQQLQTYTSLSQTRSDVKMVQSLVPIWEEEYERTGVHEVGIHSDPYKPLPEHVLKTLSLGPELNKLIELHSKAKNSPCLTPLNKDVGSSTDETDLTVHGCSPNYIDLKTFKCFKERDESGSLSSQTSKQEEDGAVFSIERDANVKLSINDKLPASSTIETLDKKAADGEVLGLLKWLASSQAADDINSDDELLRETILSPLLPATSIEKVLDKANLDYESESQKECQDILDSIDDFTDFKDSKEKASNLFDHSSSLKNSSEKIIPQLDGAGDDMFSTPGNGSGGHSSKINLKSKLDEACKDHVLEDARASFSHKHKRKKSLWGSLPFSMNQKLKTDTEPVNFFSETDIDLGQCDDSSMKNVRTNACDVKETPALVECSVRDLMRKKRLFRVDSVECGFQGVENGLERDQVEDANILPKHLDFQMLKKRPLESLDSPSQISSHVDSRSLLSHPSEPDSVVPIGHCETGQESDCQLLISDSENNDSDDDILQPPDATTSSCLQSSLGCPVLGMQSGVEGQPSSGSVHKMFSERVSMVINTNSDEKELISMTLRNKPPTNDWEDRPCEKASYCPATSYFPSFSDEECHDGKSGRALDDLPPFFMEDIQEVHETQNKCTGVLGSSSRQEAVIGVPTHYQNNGSCLYMLTTLASPPSAENVNRWLLNCTSAGDNIKKASSQNGSSSTLIGSQRALSDDCNKVSTDSGSISHLQPILAKGSQDNCGNEMRTKMQGEEDAEKVKAYSDSSQDISQISGPDERSKPTPLSQIGFRDPASVGGGQQLTMLSIEVQAESRGNLRPDPRFDSINIIVLAIQNDTNSDTEVLVLLRSKTENSKRSLDGVSGCNLMIFQEEKYLFDHFIKFVCSLDPDILIGWDVQGGSLGFLAERASYLGIGLLNLISRVPPETKMPAGDPQFPEKGLLDEMIPESDITDQVVLEDAIIEDEWGRTHASGVHVGGRIVLNVWRLMRGEVKLNMYTIEAVADAVLRRKIPYIHYSVLTKWFLTGPGRARYRCIEYWKERGKLNFEIMNQLDMINRTSELARVFGIDFFSVLSRGSQYRVESMYLRLAHAQNYLAISPGNHQVASQPAMECLPLVMEPESGFYADPVVVLDFQSLYPSMIIAYNLCYSTCLGNISPSKANTLGVSPFSPDPRVLQELKDQILLTPNGVMFVPSKVRKGVLPRLLEEILSTRIMLKQAMKKLSPSQQVLHRIFNARQLALKLIANVTYGYTAAGFSGRMPCAELADCIVQCGRGTLEKAISYVNAQDKWKARVIYGDTDSLFVLLKGRTREDAFRIGNEIASEVTAMNPNPVVLKMEKVYHPCFLLTKKRYVGYSYESLQQVEPVFDAKGIETVRRDTCAAVAKTMEQSLRLFFEHQDISEVKAYLQRQWKRIRSGRVSLQDFVFAKEVRLGTYSTKFSSLPPAAIVATKAMRTDPRAEPCYAERVPYVVIHGQPGARLVDMVVDPLDLLAVGSPYRLNDLYYINKQIIPALQRVFGLVGADLNKWFSEMPHPVREAFSKRPLYGSNPQRTRIDYYYLSRHCVLCGELVEASAHLCKQCSCNGTAAVAAVVGRTSKLEREMQHLAAICRHCGGGDWIMESGVKCKSLACSVFYERSKVQKELQGLASVAADKGLYPKCMVEWF